MADRPSAALSSSPSAGRLLGLCGDKHLRQVVVVVGPVESGVQQSDAADELQAESAGGQRQRHGRAGAGRQAAQLAAADAAPHQAGGATPGRRLLQPQRQRQTPLTAGTRRARSVAVT